ncbi:ABC transporter permease [Mesoplasma entomophilum]|uniref:ABC3 transporter permease C-terminal domain-containing protein n=1 Tax=Mesoplasma entomophilum TaxID=2149 RepID=A0A3S5XYU2_9MOLU|nr:FtsX-like permease family protein [Mesoplasma entomophilum]ATQ35418.1 hypothetical protein CS528_01390 [Mesoplasma entomophilum]ATZ19375.1 ABC transporter permease [Mesoplasma entomophilum]
MKKTSNWLLFKQGLKGIFKFKIQFVIILILSFLSIFILTTSISLRDRLNHTYNEVVKSVDKFDYEYADEFFGISGGVTSNSVSQNPMIMFVDPESYSTINGDSKTFNISFNEIYGGKTFITEAFLDQKMKSTYETSDWDLLTSKDFMVKTRNILLNYFYCDLVAALNGKETESSLNLEKAPIFAYALSLNKDEIRSDYEVIKKYQSIYPIDMYEIKEKDLFYFSTIAFSSIAAYISEINNTYNLNETNPGQLADVTYEIITGNSLRETPINPNLIVNNQNKYSLRVNNSTNSDALIKINSNSTLDIEQAIKTNGLKGISTPTFVQKNNKNNKVINLNSFKLQSAANGDDWSARLTAFDSTKINESFFNELMNDSNYDWILQGKNYANMNNKVANILSFTYKMQSDIAAIASNVDTEFRKEFSVFDNSSQVQYKVVVLDEMNHSNLKILNPDKGGRKPIAKGEILISEQFARARKIPLFSDLKVGAQNFTVVGYATDTFSYYPVVNDDLPIPQPKNTGIIYASLDTIKPLSQDAPSSNGEKITKTYAKRFVWTNEKSDMSLFNYLFATSQKPKTFSESVYRFSWDLQPQVVLAYSLFTIIVSLIIGAIALSGLLISLKKSIKANTKQIGILKALGVEPHNIALSYIAQSVIIAIFIIPLSWAIGLLVQSGFVHLFIPYFSIQLYQIQVSALPLILGFIFFGLLSVIVSFLVAWRLTNKPVIEILRVEETKKTHSWILNKMKNTVFNKSKFTLKFSITLASTNRKNIYLMTIVIFITSFLVSIGFTIPATVKTAQSAYYKNVEYSNSYNYIDNVSNAPLSKGTISYSKDPNVIDKDYTKHGDIYSYSNPSNYFESTYDSSPISKYLYNGMSANDKPVFSNTVKYLVSDSANMPSNSEGETEAKTGLFQIITEQFGNNFANGIGSQFSIGTIEQIFGLLSSSLYDATTLKPETNIAQEAYLTDALVQKKYDVITKNLTQAIPMILGSILGSNTSGGEKDWKEQILSVISSAAPAFVQSYIQDPSRVQQYGFGYGVKKIFKDSETFATNIQVSNSKNNINLTGLEKNQKAFTINDNLKNKLFVSEETLDKINNVFNGTKYDSDIVENGFKYYDHETNTINVPILPNRQALNSYELNKNATIDNIFTKQQQILFEHKNENNTTYDVLPKEAWIYDDSDFINSNYFNNSFGKDSEKAKTITNDRTGTYQTDKSYLSLYDLDNNKFTYKYLYDDQNILQKDSYLFNDFAVKNNEGISYVRPYYEFSNIKLFLPKALLNEEEKNGINKWANFNKKNGVKAEGYFENNVASNNIPSATKKAWESVYGTEASSKGYIMIKPYSLEYSFSKEESINRGLANIVQGQPLWFTDAMRANLFKQEITQVKYANTDLKVSLKSVGSLDSYNGRLTIVDQGLANLIGNFSISKKYDVNYNFFEPEIVIKAGQTINTNGAAFTSNYDKYKLHNENEDLYVSDYTKMLNNGADSLSYTQMMWNNAKFSNIDEAVDLTTGFFQTTQENNGILHLSQVPIGNISKEELRLQVADQKLLSIEKDLITQISQLAISIAMLIIVSVIITSSLLIILIGDIYITHYERFMILMKSFGYSNWKVQKYSFGTVTILSIIGWILATLLACGLIALIMFMLKMTGFAVPFIISWWPFVASLAVVSFSYFGSLILISRKVRKGDPAGLLMETHE